jgi:AraC-like DNA-binding protein
VITVRPLISTPSFILQEQSCGSYKHLEKHTNPNSLFVLVSGGGYIERGKPANILDSGAASIYPCGFEYDLETSEEGALCVSVVPRPSWLLQADCGELFNSPKKLYSAGVQACLRTIGHILERGKTSGIKTSDRLTVESSVVDLLAELARQRGKKAGGDWLKYVCLKIMASPFHRWTVEEIAEVAERHPVHVQRAFHERYGESLGHFFRRSRLERCRQLLQEGRMSLSDVALEAGFADQSHFTRAYRQMFGVTPGRERASQPED